MKKIFSFLGLFVVTLAILLGAFYVMPSTGTHNTVEARPLVCHGSSCFEWCYPVCSAQGKTYECYVYVDQCWIVGMADWACYCDGVEEMWACCE